MLKSFQELSDAIQKLTPYHAYTEFVISEYIDEDDVKEWTANGITEALQYNNDFFTIEIIGYQDAMRYLMKEDTSLIEVFDMLAEYGYEIHGSWNKKGNNLNSELMASLLATRRQEEAWGEVNDEVDKLAKEYGEYLDKVDDISAFVNTLYEYQSKSKASLEMHIYLSPYDKYKDLIMKCIEGDDMDYLLSKIIDEEAK